MRTAEASPSPSAVASASPSPSPDGAAAVTDAYKAVERAFKANAQRGTPPSHSWQKKKRRSNSGQGGAKGAAAGTPGGPRKGEAAYAADFARWRGVALDVAAPSLANNTPAQRARLVRHEISDEIRARGAVAGAQAAAEAVSRAHTEAAASAGAIAPASPSILPAAACAASPSMPWLSPSARLYSVPDHPGFFILRGALSPTAQAWWAWRALDRYSTTRHTNLTNLAALAAKEKAGKAKATETGMGMQMQMQEGSESKEAPVVDGASSRDLWQRACRSGDLSLLHALRWASLGYQYDWTAREYTPAAREPFPPELASLVSEMAEVVSLATAGRVRERSGQLRAEAALVNYYPATACMGGHVDDAEDERARGAPIVSVSLGCTAVFLLGGETRQTPPTAFYLRAGDICVMGGASRLCFHGVPRILDGTFGLPTYEGEESEGNEDSSSAAAALPLPAHRAEAGDASAPMTTVSPAPPPSVSPALSDECGHEHKKPRHDDAAAAGAGAEHSQPRPQGDAGPAARKREKTSEPPQHGSDTVAWSAERCYEQMRFADAAAVPAVASAAAPSDAASAAPAERLPAFPPGLPQPSRADLLHVFRFLRHSRINLNVRQVRPDQPEGDEGEDRGELGGTGIRHGKRAHKQQGTCATAPAVTHA